MRVTLLLQRKDILLEVLGLALADVFASYFVCTEVGLLLGNAASQLPTTVV